MIRPSCSLLICFLMLSHASAQTSSPDSAANPGSLVVGGTLRSRVEAWSWFEADSGNNQYAYSGNLLRVSLSQQRSGWDWKAEFAVPLLVGLPENALAPGVQGALGLGANYFLGNHRSRNAAMIFPKQLYVRFAGLGAGKSHAIRIGRFEFLDGGEATPKDASLAAVKRTRINQRLLGHFGWAHVGRSFDGLHYSSDKQSGNFTFVAAVPTRGVFQVDGWGWNKTAFSYGSYTRSWGKGRHAAESRALGFYYHDWRPVVKTDNRPLQTRSSDRAAVRIGTFGGHTLHAVETPAGKIDLLLWGVGQTGRWGVQRHRAGAIDVEAGFQPNVLPILRPWLRGGFYWGSGDGDRSDDRHGTFFQILPTPRPFARFPFFNLMNSLDFFGILVLRPHEKITVSSEFHALRLNRSNDLWYLGGGVFQPWTFGYVGRDTGNSGSLANLYDTSVEYRANPAIVFVGYFGYAKGLAAPAAIYPRGKDGQLGYLEVLYRF